MKFRGTRLGLRERPKHVASAKRECRLGERGLSEAHLLISSKAGDEHMKSVTNTAEFPRSSGRGLSRVRNFIQAA